MRQLGLTAHHRVGVLRQNNRAENSHLVIRRRERDEKTRRKPGFNIHRWREQQPSYDKLQAYRKMSPKQRRKQKLVL